MDDDRLQTEKAQDAGREEGAAPKKTSGWRRRKWLLIVFGVVFLVPAAMMAAWAAITLNLTYARGDRAGYIQKFSEKGWLCKTWEGQIAMVNIPGANQERFDFSVRNDSVAAEITRLMGSRVAISYEQHRGVPGTCFGDTDYFVTGVKAVPAVP